MINVARPFVDEEEVEAVREVLLSGRYLSGPEVEQFEEDFAEYLDVEHAVAVNSGTAALHLALAISGIGPGDEVIVPPLTFFSTVTSVLHQNAIPIFADIDPDSYCLNPESVREQITDRTEAIIPVHLYGQAANMDGFLDLAEENDLTIIEDASQAHGTEYREQKVGSIGDFGAFSFYATKHITTGEGGMIVTDEEEGAEKARKLRSHGMTDRDHHDYLGYNYRMDEISGAIGHVQMDKIEELNEKRIENSLYLLDQLRELDSDWYRVPELYDHIRHTFFWCPLWINEAELGYDTNELRERLEDKGIETRHRYQEPLYQQKILTEKSAYPNQFPFNSKHYPKEISYEDLYFPIVEEVAGRMIGLPNHPGLTKNELDIVVSKFNSIQKDEIG